MPIPALIVQTTYAELLERCAGAAFGEAFPEKGAFISKTVKGRRYWYFQTRSGGTRVQRYVGPETPALLEQIARHRLVRNDEGERRALVSALRQSFGLPRPIPQVGQIIEALAHAGVFRLRGVLVGTVAYQTYPGMLGVRFPHSSLQTGDVDIAQFREVSVAVEESTEPMLDVLKAIDKTFHDVANPTDSRHSSSYVAGDGFRVDFLTPARGRAGDKPRVLPAFRTDAQPLRFLDYLIYEPEPAVILHNSGICVQVPAPQRYAVHKLIVSQRRAEGSAKRDKDIQQAEALLGALVEKRPFELQHAWREAYERGPKWRELLAAGIGKISGHTRDLVLKAVGARRSVIPGLDLTFNNPPASYDISRDIVGFVADGLGDRVACAISREALDDHFGADGLGQKGRVESFLKSRSRIELMARIKYLSWPIDEPGAVLIKTRDVPILLNEIDAAATTSHLSNGSVTKRRRP
jgi:hypothetical protein